MGIVTAMLDPGGGGFAGIGFAVPIETGRGRRHAALLMTFLWPELLWLLLLVPAVIALYLLVCAGRRKARCASRAFRC